MAARNRLIRLFAAGAACAAPLPWIAGYFMPPLNGDVAAILLFAVRMVAGDRLYVDLIDVNPPLIFLINVIPAALSAWLGIQPASMFVAFVLALAGGSVFLATRVLRDDKGRPAPSGLAGTGFLIFVLMILPGGNLGEREHLMIVLALPWLALGVARLKGASVPSSLAVGIALAAGAGFLIKPYFLPTPLIVEVYLLSQLGMRAWRRRPELWVLPATLAVYALVLLICFPDYLETVAPTAARHYVQTHIGLAFGHVFGQGERWIIPLGLAVLAMLGRHRPAVAIACCLTSGGLISAMLQGKGWDYHMLPAWSGLALGAAALLLETSLRRPVLAVLAASASLTVFAIGHPPLARAAQYDGSVEDRLTMLVRSYAEDRPVLWFTENVWPEYPAILYAAAKPAMANMELWLLGSLYGAEPAAWRPVGKMGGDEQRLFQSVVRSFTSAPPALVVVEPKPIDFIGYFSRDPGFAQAWSQYREVQGVGAIRLYVRTPETASAP